MRFPPYNPTKHQSLPPNQKQSEASDGISTNLISLNELGLNSPINKLKKMAKFILSLWGTTLEHSNINHCMVFLCRQMPYKQPTMADVICCLIATLTMIFYHLIKWSSVLNSLVVLCPYIMIQCLKKLIKCLVILHCFHDISITRPYYIMYLVLFESPWL